jgi:16S rRNA pseudouridine516 synthase
MDYFPASMREKFSPVGRLDRDTEGLLLVTNDGALNHRLTSPAHHVDKTYFARLDVPVPKEAVSLFAAGVDIGDDKPTLPAKLVLLPDEREAELTIREGRFHQVKRMFEAVGCNVVYLKRLSMGGLTLGALPKGEYRKLSPEEMKHEV